MLLAGSKNSESIGRGLLTLQGLPDIVFAAEPLQGNLRECAGGDLNWAPLGSLVKASLPLWVIV